VQTPRLPGVTDPPPAGVREARARAVVVVICAIGLAGATTLAFGAAVGVLVFVVLMGSVSAWWWVMAQVRGTRRAARADQRELSE